MTSTASGIADFLLTYGVHGVVALLLLAGARRVTGPWPPGFRDAAWKAAVVATLLTAAVASLRTTGSGSGYGVAEVRRDLVLRGDDGSSTLHRERVILSARSARTPDCGQVLRARELPGSARSERIVRECAAIPPWLPSGLVLGWLTGALVAGVRRGRGRAALRRHLGLRPASAGGPAARTLARLRERGAGPARGVRLVESPILASPAVLGAGTIGLPVGAEEVLPPTELEAVLAHELCHLERGDPHWMAVLDGLETLFWYQPLLRGARREIRDAAELLCDEGAARRTGAPRELARALARVGGWVAGAAPGPELAVVRPGGGRLEGRVRRLLEPSPRTPATVPWGVRAVLVAVTLVGASAAALPGIRLPDPPRVEVVEEQRPPSSPPAAVLRP